MNRQASILLILLLGVFVVPSTFAQDVKQLMTQAQQYEKAFNDEAALKKYLEVLKVQPHNAELLIKISELYSLVGKRQESKNSQKEYYTKGKQYAEQALKIAPDNSDANFVMSVAMGRMAMMYSGEEKVKAVIEVKKYADKCVQLDPRNFKGYHVLAKWNYEVSDLNAIERWIIKVGYGGLPKASMDNAAMYYEKSMQLNPSFLLNYLELAKVYRKKDEIAKARNLLIQMQKMPLATADDAKIKRLGKEMLDDL